MNANQRKLIVAMSLCAAAVVPHIASAASIPTQGTWSTTLQGRDLDSNLTTAFAPDMEYRLSLTDTSLRPQQKNLVDLAVGDCSDILSIEELPNKAIQSDARTSLR